MLRRFREKRSAFDRYIWMDGWISPTAPTNIITITMKVLGTDRACTNNVAARKLLRGEIPVQHKEPWFAMKVVGTWHS